MAQSVTQIVLFRVLQGAFGAALVPLSQTVLLSTYPRERQGFAMALFGMGVMVGPVLGPVLGGWLTENYSWRWVFYINLPIGIIALLGMIAFLPETPRNSGEKLDWFGFGTLSLAIGALQIMLDRGEQKDWFSSGEIMIEAIVAVSASICSWSTPSRPNGRSSGRRCSAIATSPRACCSFRSSASLTIRRWRCSRRICKRSWAIRWSPPAWSWDRAAWAPWPRC